MTCLLRTTHVTYVTRDVILFINKIYAPLIRLRRMALYKFVLFD